MERIDTHQTVKDLIAAGLTENQAEAVTSAINNTSNLATKEDIRDLKRDIKDIRVEIKHLEDKIVNKLILWIIGSAFSITVSILGILSYLLK